MKKRLLALLCVFSLLIPSLAFASSAASEDIVYGVALDDNQKSQMNQAFGLTSIENVEINTVDGNDLEKYLGYNTADYNMISSVYIKHLADGSGIKVNIVTPANITQITNSQYTNAAITAGITDADIFVASPKPVTGESALVGVYKALEATGQVIDVERAQTAQKELEVVSEISEENKNETGFDPTELDKVVIEVKQRLAAHKEETGSTASTDQIIAYVNDALNNVNMENILSDNNINILVQYFNQYQNTDAIDSKEVRDNLYKLGNDLADKASQFYAENKDTIDETVKEAQESGLLDSLLNFFSAIINGIAKIFSSNNQ